MLGTEKRSHFLKEQSLFLSGEEEYFLLSPASKSEWTMLHTQRYGEAQIKSPDVQDSSLLVSPHR